MHIEKSLSESLRDVLSAGDKEKGIAIGEILDSVEGKGFGLLLITLSLPSALPIPAAGYSTPFGIALFIIGVQMLIGRHKPTLPKWICNRRIPRKLGETMLGFAARVMERLEKFIRPRGAWIETRWAGSLAALLIMIMAFLMILPIPGTNTAPAGAIFLIGIGLTERDGVFGGFAIFAALVATALYAVALYAVFFLGAAGLEGGIEWVKSVIKGGG